MEIQVLRLFLLRNTASFLALIEKIPLPCYNKIDYLPDNDNFYKRLKGNSYEYIFKPLRH